MAEEKPIGKVTHYFGDIKVAVIKLSQPLKVGEKIRITGGEETDFTQTVKSIEADHEKIQKAKARQTIGLKINKKAREGYKVYRL